LNSDRRQSLGMFFSGLSAGALGQSH